MHKYPFAFVYLEQANLISQGEYMRTEAEWKKLVKNRDKHEQTSGRKQTELRQLQSKFDRMELKINKLKDLILLVDPVVSNVVVGETQLTQWLEYCNTFPDERATCSDH